MSSGWQHHGGGAGAGARGSNAIVFVVAAAVNIIIIIIIIIIADADCCLHRTARMVVGSGWCCKLLFFVGLGWFNQERSRVTPRYFSCSAMYKVRSSSGRCFALDPHGLSRRRR